MVSIKHEGLPAVRNILKPGLVQNNYETLLIDPNPLVAVMCVCTCVRSPLSPHVGFKTGNMGSFSHIALSFYVLFNTWQLLVSKGSGTLEAVAALNKTHFEWSNGNDSCLIIFEYVSLYLMCAVNNVKSADKKS